MDPEIVLRAQHVGGVHPGLDTSPSSILQGQDYTNSAWFCDDFVTASKYPAMGQKYERWDGQASYCVLIEEQWCGLSDTHAWHLN